MRWLVAISVVRAGNGPVLPGSPFVAPTTEMGDELVALDAARDARPDEIPAEADGMSPAPAGTGPVLADLPPLHELRMAAIAAAVATLSDADFTKFGHPRVASLKPKLDFDPKGAELLQFKREIA